MGCIHVGLFEHDELTGVVTFGQPSSQAVAKKITRLDPCHVAELCRLALTSESVPATQLISEGIKIYQQYREQAKKPKLRIIVSFADYEQGHHGGVYQAASWLYCGVSRGTSTVYIDAQDNRVQRRWDGKNINIEQARAMGLKRAKPSNKARYIKLVGSSKQRRHALESLKLTPQPYPKPTQRAYQLRSKIMHF